MLKAVLFLSYSTIRSLQSRFSTYPPLNMPFFLNEEHEYDEQQLSDLAAQLNPSIFAEQTTPGPSYPSILINDNDNYRTTHESPCSLSSGSTISDDTSEISVTSSPHSTTFHFNDSEDDLEFDFGVSVMDDTPVTPPISSSNLDSDLFSGAYEYPNRTATNTPLPIVLESGPSDYPASPLSSSSRETSFIPNNDQTHLPTHPILSSNLPYVFDDSPPQYGLINGGLGLDLEPPSKVDIPDEVGMYNFGSGDDSDRRMSGMITPPPIVFPTSSVLGLVSYFKLISKIKLISIESSSLINV